MKVKFVVATRVSAEDFFEKTATGRSLRLQKSPNMEIWLTPDNRAGLPQVYNAAIQRAAAEPAVLIFAHDDLHILDLSLADQVCNALQRFDIIGLAGNKRRFARQPAWAFIDEKFTWDEPENLSGAVGHGPGFPPTSVEYYGPSPQEVKLLDGVFLAAHSAKLINAGIAFDERFDFHFYDMDFCRQAEVKNLKCGTWPISVVHESGGGFGSPAWVLGYAHYLAKWGT